MPQKITFFFTETNQPSTKAIFDFNQQIHQLMSKASYLSENLDIAIREIPHNTQSLPES
jgi:hypothetical protein